MVICTQYLLASKPFNQTVCNCLVETLVYLPNKRLQVLNPNHCVRFDLKVVGDLLVVDWASSGKSDLVLVQKIAPCNG